MVSFPELFLRLQPTHPSAQRLSESVSLLQDWSLAIGPSVVSPVGPRARRQSQGTNGSTISGWSVVGSCNHPFLEVCLLFSYDISMQFLAYHLTEAGSELMVPEGVRSNRLRQNTMVEDDVPNVSKLDFTRIFPISARKPILINLVGGFEWALPPHLEQSHSLNC